MKYLFLIVAALATLARAEDAFLPKNLDVSKEFIQNLMKSIGKFDARGGGTTAIMNDYADKVIANTDSMIIHNGLDPFQMSDIPIPLVPMGQLNLTKGWLQGMASIKRNGDVIMSYSSTSKVLETTTPIVFDNLMFSYDYCVKVTIVSVCGGVEGKVDNLRINLILDFDFNTYHFVLKKFDITDTGKLTMHFTGHALLDWLINLMSDAISFVLHPLIINIINSLVKTPISDIFDLINNIIDGILHPITTAAPTTTGPPTNAFY